MKMPLRVEGEVTADGRLRIELPFELPRGPVLMTLEALQGDDFELTEDDLKGRGLTAEEIASSVEIGAWSGNDVPSGAEYVERLRPEYSREDLGNGVRGKHLDEYRSGTNLVLLSPEVAAIFPDDKSVNEALLSLVRVAERSAGAKRESIKRAPKAAHR